MDIHSEILKSVRKRHGHRRDLGPVLQKRLVTGKPEINDVSFILDRLPDIRLHEELKLGKLTDTPDHIIAEPDVVKSLVHFRNTAFYSVKCCHFLHSFRSLSIEQEWCAPANKERRFVLNG